MNYIYAYVAPYSQDGLIEIEILPESEIMARLQLMLGLTNKFYSIEDLIDFAAEYNMLEPEGGEKLTISTLTGEILLQIA